MAAWTSRPLQPVYAAVFTDALYVKVRDGQVGNQPFYAAIGVDLIQNFADSPPPAAAHNPSTSRWPC